MKKPKDASLAKNVSYGPMDENLKKDRVGPVRSVIELVGIIKERKKNNMVACLHPLPTIQLQFVLNVI